MKSIIENILIILGATIIMTFVITSIEKADVYTDDYNEKTSIEIWEQQARVERFVKGVNN